MYRFSINNNIQSENERIVSFNGVILTMKGRTVKKEFLFSRLLTINKEETFNYSTQKEPGFKWVRIVTLTNLNSGVKQRLEAI